MKNTNRAHLMTPCVTTGFAAGFVSRACAGFLVESIILLKGRDFESVCEEKRILKSLKVKCRYTYGVILTKEYLQVARG